MARHRQPQQRRIPAERSRAFDVIADKLAGGSVVVAVTSRAVRRQYLRGVAKRGGDVDRLHFVRPANLSQPAGARRRRPARDVAGGRSRD